MNKKTLLKFNSFFPKKNFFVKDFAKYVCASSSDNMEGVSRSNVLPSFPATITNDFIKNRHRLASNIQTQ